MKGRNEFNLCNEVYKTLDKAQKLSQEYNISKILSVGFLCAILAEETNELSKFLKEKQINLKERKAKAKEIMEAAKQEYELQKNDVLQTEEVEDVVFDLINQKNNKEYTISEDFKNVLTLAKNFQNEKQKITNEALIKAFTFVNFQIMNNLFAFFELDNGETMSEFLSYIQLIYFPSSLVKCLEDLTAKVDPESECLILKRDKEIRDIYRGLLKADNNDVVLVGAEGTGKSAIIEKLCWNIVNENCPEELKGVKIFSLDIKGFLAGLSLISEDNVKNIFSDLETFFKLNKDIILFIDGDALIDTNEVKFGGLNTLINTIKTIVLKSKVRVIFEANYQIAAEKLQDAVSGFEVVEVKDFKSKEVPKVLQRKIKMLEKKHNVKIGSNMVKYLHNLCIAKYLYAAPMQELLNAIDSSMAETKFSNNKYVTQSAVKEVFRRDFEKYEKLLPEEKKTTAFHEAGHFITSYFSEKVCKEEKVVIVSIIPTDSTLGVNVLEETDMQGSGNTETFNEYLASLLAGRVAEKKYTGTNSCGAMQDMQCATIMAKKMVDKFGLCNSFSKNRIYIPEMYSEKSINQMNDEVDKIIDQAYKTAEKTIQEYEQCLNEIVDALLKKGILDSDELDKICKPYKEEM